MNVELMTTNENNACESAKTDKLVLRMSDSASSEWPAVSEPFG
jgi:hypothetical protein